MPGSPVETGKDTRQAGRASLRISSARSSGVEPALKLMIHVASSLVAVDEGLGLCDAVGEDGSLEGEICVLVVGVRCRTLERTRQPVAAAELVRRVGRVPSMIAANSSRTSSNVR
jgi:hypothetical protein